MFIKTAIDYNRQEVNAQTMVVTYLYRSNQKKYGEENNRYSGKRDGERIWSGHCH